MRRVAEISILVREPASGLVHSECAVDFRSPGDTVRGPGYHQLERMLDR
jgi:hypothetical protein